MQWDVLVVMTICFLGVTSQERIYCVAGGRKWMEGSSFGTWAEKTPNVAPGGFLAIAENGRAVDLGGGPDAEREGDQEQQGGEQHLPDGDTEGNAQQHGYGRGEGDDGEPDAEAAGGLADHGGEEQEGQYQGDGEGQGELLRVGLVVDQRARRGKEGGIEQVAKNEIEDKEEDEHGKVDARETFDEVLDAVVYALAGLVLRGTLLFSLVLVGGFGAFGGDLGLAVAGGGLLEKVGMGELDTRNQCTGQKHPQGELCKAHKPYAHHLSHHELEGLDATNNDFDNAAGFLLHDAAHHL